MVKEIVKRGAFVVLGILLGLLLCKVFLAKDPVSHIERSNNDKQLRVFNPDTLSKWISQKEAKLLVKNNPHWDDPYGDSSILHQRSEYIIITKDTLYKGTDDFEISSYSKNDSLIYVSECGYPPHLSFYPIIARDSKRIVYLNDSIKETIILSQYHDRLAKRSVNRIIENFLKVQVRPDEPELFQPAMNCHGGQYLVD
ncbi:MAG: hypothetical protein IKT00_03340 [Prevotella sp.]|nr:hypothetical protein [Prevotella sp.]